MVIALGIAFINTALNRVLINYFIGWEQYRVMQKEMNEYGKKPWLPQDPKIRNRWKNSRKDSPKSTTCRQK